MSAQPKETASAACERLSIELGGKGGEVTRQMVAEWRKKYPEELHDPEELKKRLLAQVRPPTFLIDQAVLDPDRPELAEVEYRFKAARMLKTEAEAELKATEAQAARERWKTTAQDAEDGMRLGSILRSFTLQLENHLPPVLEGLTGAQMKQRIREESARIMQEVRRLCLEKRIPLGEDAE